MDSFDIFYTKNYRPDPHPLTKVDFFHAKRRALKAANAIATAKGLPPRKSGALYIDMAVVRNFDHYDDIGAISNDPVARELVRRQEMEAAEVKRQGKTVEQDVLRRKKAREEELRRDKIMRAKEQLQRARAREVTKKRAREAFKWQPKPGAGAAPPIHAPKIRKRKKLPTEDNEHVNKKLAVDPVIETVVDTSKEDEGESVDEGLESDIGEWLGEEVVDDWLADIPLPSTEFDDNQEDFPIIDTKPHFLVDALDVKGTSPSVSFGSEGDVV